jgi:hypothetical protein
MRIAQRWIFLDGTSPAGNSPRLQWERLDISLPEGEDLTIDVSAVGQNGTAYSLVGGSAPVIAIKASPADTSPITPAIGATNINAAAGTFDLVVARGLVPKGAYFWDGYFLDAGNKSWRGMLTSPYLVTDGSSDVGGPFTTPGPLAWTPYDQVTGNGVIAAGDLIKASATATRYEILGAADDPSLMVGVAKTACAGAGSSFEAYFISGIVTPCNSDGTGTIAAGAPVEKSSTVAGKVKQAASPTSAIGFNVGALVAATLNASVSVR